MGLNYEDEMAKCKARKVRLSICFDCTVAVSGDSTPEVALQEAKDAVDYCLPYALDGESFLDCTVLGVNNINSEEL